ncbi:MAG: hypothetical protein SCH66_10200 [Methanolobus sp.]|nr:hypothetical protein [Methanolobus sp.]
MGRITVAVASIFIFILLISACVGSDTAFRYKGDKENNVYHEHSCSEVANISSYNLVLFDTPEKAVSSVYRPCSICNPAGSTTELKGSDTDEDSISDYDEIYVYSSNHLKQDSDGDGSDDYFEILVDHTNPMSRDTDKDGLEDPTEVLIYKTNPTNSDSDGDGLSDFEEVYLYLTDPLSTDTDNDGVNDYKEIFVGNTNLENFDVGKSLGDDSKYDLPKDKVKRFIFGYAFISIFLIVVFIIANKIKQNKINSETEQEKVVRQVFEEELQKQYAENADKVSSGDSLTDFFKVAAIVFILAIILKSIYLIFSSMLILLLGTFLYDLGRTNNIYISQKCNKNALKITAEKTADKKLQHLVQNQKKREVQFTMLIIILCIVVALVLYKLFL